VRCADPAYLQLDEADTIATMQRPNLGIPAALQSVARLWK